VQLSPDEIVYWQSGFFKLNSTILTTWLIMISLTILSFLVTRRLAYNAKVAGWQSFLEIIVTGINEQISEAGLDKPEKYISFLGTIFLFIGVSNLLTILPEYTPPTSSLSTTVALSLCVFFAVPFYGISSIGVGSYLKSYIEPTFIMLPFNIISEISRTLAMAIRLFGNMMSGGMIIGILLSITPFLFPIIMTVLGLLTGMVQAYIFTILATVYISAAIRSNKTVNTKKQKEILNG